MVCSQLPCRNSQVTYSISTWLTIRQAFLPTVGRRLTTMSTPRCPCSRNAMIAPRKVIQTNRKRDSSSDTVMPMLKA